MKILVTGGMGFIGSALIRRLLENDSNIIMNIDNLSYASDKRNLSSIENKNNYDFIKVDICDSSSVERIFNKFNPDGIIHLAAESHVDKSIESPMRFIETNIIGTYNLLQSATKYWKLNLKENKDIFKFHHVSTDEVYGDLKKDDPIFTEASPYKPSSPYSATKASSDHLVRAWNRTYGLPTIITNCSNNYGPYQYPEKLIPKTIINALNHRKIPIYGDGTQIRDWLHVDDHVLALEKVFMIGSESCTYNIGGNCEKTNVEVIKNICDYLDTVVPIHKEKNIKSYYDLVEHIEDRQGHDYRYSIDNNKIRDELKWEPKIKFNNGIKMTVDWYIENKWRWELNS